MNIKPGQTRCSEIVYYNTGGSATSQCKYAALPGHDFCGKHDPDRRRCPAKNFRGEQCRQRWKTETGSAYCPTHHNQSYQAQEREDYPELKPTDATGAYHQFNPALAVIKQIELSVSAPPDWRERYNLEAELYAQGLRPIDPEYDQALADLNDLVVKQKLTASKPPMLAIRSDDEDKKAS